MTERDDRQDIADLLVRYASGIDRGDWPLFRTVFTEDCRLDYGEIGVWRGVDAVTEFMERCTRWRVTRCTGPSSCSAKPPPRRWVPTTSKQ